MTTFTVSADKRFASSLEYISTRLGAVKVGLKQTPNKLVVNACKNTEMVAATILDALCEVIVTDCKAHYIREKLRVKITDPVMQCAFIRALSTFDYETDKLLVGGLLKLTPTFLLSSFYDFCLDDLKKRWDEVCVLANENIALLLVERNLNELIRFLIQSIQPKVNQVYLRNAGEHVELLDRNMELVEGVYVNPTLTADANVVEKLVALSPRKIFFIGEWCEFFDKVNDIFTDCVAIDNTTLTVI